MPDPSCDLLIHSCGQVVGFDSGKEAPVSVSELEELPIRTDAAIAVAEGSILEVGPSAALRELWVAAEELDGGGRVVVPGFVDAHTHPAFATGRAREFDWRARGLGYVEIAEQGGGILSSVRHVREASEERLAEQVAAHFRRMQAHGTTTCEAKSGYGLTTEDELKSLRAIHAAAARTGMQVRGTFLGAHMVPLEHREDPDRYLDLLCEESLPAAAESGLAAAADVFIEGHAFDLPRARRYLERARELGFGLRVHAEQFENTGGTALAVELGAESVDHLEALDEAGVAKLAASETHAGLLPAVPHFLRQTADAPARALLDAGARYFVSTDFNPGSCYTPSVPEALHFARVRLRLTALEALAGATTYAAASLGLGDRKGRIAAGYDADLLLLDLPDVFHLGYGFGENPVARVVIGGRLLPERERPVASRRGSLPAAER